MGHHILLIGASGSGTTATAKALAASLHFKHCDLDSLLWEDTDPPFQQKKSFEALRSLATAQIYVHENWVISGDPSTWMIDIEQHLTLAVWLLVPTEVRLDRIRLREQKRFGDAVKPGGYMYEMHQKFLAWAEKYDIGGINGRTRAGQAQWLTSLPCPVLTIEGDFPISTVVDKIKTYLSALD